MYEIIHIGVCPNCEGTMLVRRGNEIGACEVCDYPAQVA